MTDEPVRVDELKEQDPLLDRPAVVEQGRYHATRDDGDSIAIVDETNPLAWVMSDVYVTIEGSQQR